MTNFINRRLVVTGRLVLLCLVVNAAIAQPPPPLPEPSVNPANTPSVVKPLEEPNVRRIYVPTEELDSLLRGDRHGVLLPRDEFARLYAAARDAEESQLHQPGDVLVTAADYDAVQQGELLRLSVDVRVHQFARGWQVLRLPLGFLGLRSAAIDGQPAAVTRDETDRNMLLILSESAGEHHVRLELTAPLKPVGSDWLAEFPTLGAPSGVLTLAVAAGKSLLVDGLKTEPAAALEGKHRYDVPLGGRASVSLLITDDDLRHAADALVFASTAYIVQVAPGEVTWTTQTSVQAYGQSLSQLSFTVPRELEIARIESPGLEEWTLAETDRGRRTQLTLTFRQPFSGERGVTIRGVLAPEGDEWTVPNLELLEADSHAATLVVRHGPDVRLRAEHGDEIRAVADVAEGNPSSQVTARYRTMVPDFDLEFRTLGKPQSVQIAMTNLLDISDDGLDLHTVMDVSTEFAALFDVRIALPADFEVVSATVGGASVDWSLRAGAAGVVEVRLPLDPPLKPGDTRRLSLQAHADPEDWPVERDAVLLPFPQVGLPQADMVEARYGIMAEPDLEVRVVELAGLDPARQGDLAGLQQAASSLGRELRLGFNYQDTVFSGQLEIRRKPTLLAVATLSLSRLTPQTVHTDIRAFVTVEGGGTHGLLVQLPASVGEDVRFSVVPAGSQPVPQQPTPRIWPIPGTVSIVEQSVSEPIDGLRTWTLRFDRRMRGDHVLVASLVEPRAGDASVTLPVPSLMGAERQNGWLAIEARDEQRLVLQTMSAAGEPLQSVDPIDLPGLGGDGTRLHRIVGAYRYVTPGPVVTVTEEKFTQSPLPTALADRLETTSVLGESGWLANQLDLSFRAIGMQSLRLLLPPDADVWSVSIDGTPAEVRHVDGTFQVPLRGVDAPDASRSLRVIYRSRTTPPGLTGRLREFTPVVAAVSGSGRAQPLEILEQHWTLHYPRDLVLLSSQGLFRPATGLAGDRWLTGAADLLTLPTARDTGLRLGAAAVVALVIGVWLLLWRRLGYWTLALGLVGLPIIAITVFLVLLGLSRSVRFELGEVAGEAANTAATSEWQDLAEGFEGDADHRFGGAGFGGGGMAPPSPAEGMPAIAGQMGAQSFDAEQPATSPLATAPAPPPQFEDGVVDESMNRWQYSNEALRAAEDRPSVSFARGATLGGEPVKSPHGALLSLSLDLERPEGSRMERFQALSTLTGGEPPALELTYSTRTFREVVMLILAAGLTLLLWGCRQASARTKWFLVLLTIVLPVAVGPVVPPLAVMVAEGVLLGGCLGALLWGVHCLVRAAVRCCSRWCPTGALRSSGPLMPALLLVTSWWMTSTTAPAAEPAATEGLRVESSVAPVPVAPHPVVPHPEGPTVVIPYAEEGPLSAERVYLPQELFRELWWQAHPEERPRAAAPREGLVAEAFYAVQVTADDLPTVAGSSSLQVAARYLLFGFHQKAVRIPLPLGQVALTEARLNDEPAIIVPDRDGRPAVLIQSPGLHVLDVRFDLPAELGPTSGELTLPIHPVSAGGLSLTLPASAEERAVRVLADGQPVAFTTAVDGDGRTQVEVTIDGGGPLRISWQPPATRGATDAILHVESRTAVDLTDDGVQLTAEFAFQVRQGRLNEVPFAFPETVRLKRLTGPDVGGWQIDGMGDDRTLTVFLRRNVDDRTQVTAELYVPREFDDGAFDLDVPAFAPRGVAHETGEVAILAGAHLELTAGHATGLRQLNRETVTLPAIVARPATAVQLAYRFPSRPWELQVLVRPKPPQATAVAEHGVFVGQRTVRYSTRVTFDLSGAPRQSLAIALTEDFLLTSLTGEGIVDWFVEDAELTIDFGQPRVGKLSVALEGHVPREAEDASAVVITPLPLNIDRQQSLLAVWVDPLYAATLDSFDTWRTIDRAELPEELRELHPEEARFAFRSAAVEPELVNLELGRQQPLVTVDAVTLIAVSDVSVDYGLTFRWTIERAATDALAFTLPGWLQDQLEITGPNIRSAEQTVSDDGTVQWLIQLSDAVRGQYLLTAIATLPPPEDGRVLAPTVGFLHPPSTQGGDYLPIEAQQSFAVLVNLSAGRLSPVGDLGALQVRRDQLPLVLRDRLLAQAMTIVRVPRQSNVVWTLQRVREQETQAAQITAAELTTVLAIDGSLRTLARYRVRNRGQQYLALKLPQTAQMLSVMVKDRPARSFAARIGEQDVRLIPLPQTSITDLSFLIDIVLQDRLPGVDRLDARLLGRDLALPVPAVITPRQSPEYGMPVIHTSWTVQVPEDLDVSLIDDVALTNVSQQSTAVARAMTELQLYRELADLNRMLAGKNVSSMQRRQLAANLNVLGKQLESESELSRDGNNVWDRLPESERELAGQRERLLEESLNNVQREQELVPGTAEDNTPGSAMNFNTLGRSYILGNNDVIAADNMGKGAVIAGSKLQGFRFTSPQGEVTSDKARKQVDSKKSGESRALLRDRLSSQVPQQQLPNEPAVRRGHEALPSQRAVPGRPSDENFSLNGADPIELQQQMQEFDSILDLGFDAAGGWSADVLGIPDHWDQAGGLSLPIQLPTAGQSLTFTKLGGDPRLSLQVRPRSTTTSVVRWMWLLVVAIAGAWLLHQLACGATLRDQRVGVSLCLMVVGLLVLLCLPLPVAVLGGGLLVVGCLLGYQQWLVQSSR